MSIFQITEIQAISFLLVFARMSSFLVSWPLLGGLNVPAPVKILLSLLLSFIFFPILKNTMAISVQGLPHLAFLVGKEVLIGLILGFTSYLFFYAVQMGSELIGISMGVSSAQMFNPTMAVSMTPVDHFCSIFAGLFFLLINGHHIFLTGLLQSYDIFPAHRTGLGVDSLVQIALTGKQIFIIGFQLSAPVLVSILLINISMAIVGRAVPQMNVLITSMSVNVLVGVVLLALSVPLLWSGFSESAEFFMSAFLRLIKTI